DAPIHAERATVKLFVAAQVRDGLTLAAPLDEIAVTRQLDVGQLAVRLDDDAHSIGVERVREQELGLEPRALDSPASEIVGRPAHHAADRPDFAHPVSALRSSATARSTAARSSSRRASLFASKRSTSTAPVFDARTRPHAPSPKRMRAPS